MIRGVIFDLDGVLVSTDQLHYLAWKKIADELGIPFDQRVNHRLRGLGRMESLEIILERSGRVFPTDEKQRVADRKNRAYQATLRTLGADDTLPGAREVLASLRSRGVKIGLASGSRNARTIIERVGLGRAFDAMVDGNDLTHSKPHPEVFLLAAGQLDLPPDACLVVEDAAAGVEAARRAGMAVLGIGSPEALPGVAPLVASLAEVDIDLLLEGRIP